VTAPEPSDGLAVWRTLGAAAYDRERLEAFGRAAMGYLHVHRDHPSETARSWATTVDVLDRLDGETLQERWDGFQGEVWPGWMRNQTRPPGRLWSDALRRIQIGRVVCSDLELPGVVVPLMPIVAWLPPDDAFRLEVERLRAAIRAIRWVEDAHRQLGGALGVRVMLRHGYDRLEEITEHDLRQLPGRRRGADVLDGALCQLGVFGRTSMRGTARSKQQRRRSPAELAQAGEMPPRFRPITALYLQTYAERVSDVYGTLRSKRDAIARFWRYIDAVDPAVGDASAITPAHGKAYVAFARQESARVRRTDDTTTAYAWLVDVRTFFADLIDWAAEPGSPFAGRAPAAPPLTRGDLRDAAFVKSRRRRAAKTQATVLDLEREMPKIRAYAVRTWTEAAHAATADPSSARAVRNELDAFWDWAVLELLVQSGLRVEEACELTTLDVLSGAWPTGASTTCSTSSRRSSTAPGCCRSATASGA
jgi:hypothetical protein